jgi:hypothetical protein
MWKAETRRTYDRKGLRYPTDVTDAEGELASPLSMSRTAGRGGSARLTCVRCSTPCSTGSAQGPMAGAAQGPAPAQHRARRLRALAV